MKLKIAIFSAVCLVTNAAFAADKVEQTFLKHPGVKKLQEEVRTKGWIVFSAFTDRKEWDLFLSRPDGSQRQRITNTPDWSEAAPRFSPNGKKILYRRIIKGKIISHDRWGFQGELVIADRDGKNAKVMGKRRQYTWACWNPDGSKLSCLSLRGIEVVSLNTMQVESKLKRNGVFQQLFWSPNGKWFVGTANVGGVNWTIVRLDAKTGKRNIVSQFRNCTPDWFPDSKRVIFSNRPAGQSGSGWTQLWMADAAGKSRKMIYGEDGRHIYGGALSPDAKYVLFTRCPQDGGGSEREGAPAALMRLSDGPIIGGTSAALRKSHSKDKVKDGPVLPLPNLWEPHWTYAE